jgi:hypothetical protein
MLKYEYTVRINNDIVNQGKTSSKQAAINAFKGFGRGSYGNIVETLDDGSITEIGHKAIGKSLYCW